MLLFVVGAFVVRSCTASNYEYGSVEETGYKELNLIEDG